jgi:hypothetical protein
VRGLTEHPGDAQLPGPEGSTSARAAGSREYEIGDGVGAVVAGCELVHELLKVDERSGGGVQVGLVRIRGVEEHSVGGGKVVEDLLVRTTRCGIGEGAGGRREREADQRQADRSLRCPAELDVSVPASDRSSAR